MSDAVTWAADGTGHTSSSGTATIAPRYDLPITVAAAFACISGVLTGCVMPSMVGTVSAVSSPIRPIVSNGITAIASYSATSEGIP